MNENQTKKIAIYKPSSGFLVDFSQVDEIANRLKLMIMGGRQLVAPEAMALALYAKHTGLDPFNGEAYYIPGKGPGPGIMGIRRKAFEQLEYEASMLRDSPPARYWLEEVTSTPEELDTCEPEKGDIHVTVVLRDSITHHQWEQSVWSKFLQMLGQTQGAIPESACWDRAVTATGAEQSWRGNGCVWHTESFGKDGVEAFDRRERALKRAEKVAVKKRFPRLTLPEPAGWDEDSVIDARVRVVENPQMSARVPRRDEANILNELGYSVSPVVVESTPKTPPLVQQEALQSTESVDPKLASLVSANLAQDVPDAARLANLLKLGQLEGEAAVGRARLFRTWVDKGDTEKTAAMKAIAGQVK